MTLGGCYRAYIWDAPSDTAIDFTASGSLESDDLGTQGDEVIAINLPEVGKNTHDLTSGTPYVEGFVRGIPSPLTSSTDSTPVYEIVLYDSEACT